MVARPTTRLAAALAAATGLLISGLVAAAPSDSAAARRDTNPTGTAAGSQPNGAGNLKVSLQATADGRIRVSWRRPGPARNFKKFVVSVGPSRPLDARVKRYRVSPKRRSIVVDRAVDTYTSSGNFTFVRVAGYRKVKRKTGTITSSPGKWIQAPLAAGCTAAPQDRVTVGTFNVLTWSADTERDTAKWSLRGPNVVSGILRSGARAVAIQEASGGVTGTYGGVNQSTWILRELNRTDPDPRAHWVDALTPEDYRPPRGAKGGMLGTRVFYDESAFDKLDSGLTRLTVPSWDKDALLPWARLRAVSGDQSAFVLASTHLRVGPDAKAYATRTQQVQKVIAAVTALHQRFGDQVVVAGDMNSTANQLPMNYVQRELLRAGMYDSFATASSSGAAYATTNHSQYPVPKNPLRRDYIFTYGSAKGSCAYVNRVYHTKASEASDHFMQVAVLPLPPAAPAP